MKTPLLALSLLSGTAFTVSLVAQSEQPPIPPSPEDVVIEMMSGYDADENDNLSAEELLTALEGIREDHRAARGSRFNRERPPVDDSSDRPRIKKSGRRPGPPPPDVIVPQLIADFDLNGDNELNTEELLEAITFMHQNRGPRGPRGDRPCLDSVDTAE